MLVCHRERIAVHAIAGAKWPLKSAVQRSLGRVVVIGTTPGCWTWRRRRRFLTSPVRAKRSPAVLTAGRATAGWRGPSQSRSLSGPQLGCCRRASQISLATASLILCVHCCGARLRSPSPSRPPHQIGPATCSPFCRRCTAHQLGHVVQGQAMIPNEAFSLFHRCRLQPGHRSTSQSIPSVVVSPMFPVCSVTDVPGSTEQPANEQLQPTIGSVLGGSIVQWGAACGLSGRAVICRRNPRGAGVVQ